MIDWDNALSNGTSIEQAHLPASLIQEWLGVEDGDVIAHGYTFDRDTVDVFFEDGKLVRYDTPYDKKPKITESFEFDAAMLHNQIKRWYRNKTNPRLVVLMNTFWHGVGYSMSLVN